MQSFDANAAASEIAPVQTKTLTIQPAAKLAETDDLAATRAFIWGANASEGNGYVEEDSTDIFTLERCSPLNDF